MNNTVRVTEISQDDLISFMETFTMKLDNISGQGFDVVFDIPTSTDVEFHKKVSMPKLRAWAKERGCKLS